jgi:DNA polymerase-3 subunit gamma/tau
MAGQEFVVATLKSSIESKQIAHAYLFSGPRGCGKTSAARILARSLNCEKGPTATPCGVCPSCLEIARGASLDIIEIDGASNTGVNDVRAIKDEVLFPPNAGRYKVYIIDEVHMLSNSAFNALLKTIEEPPPYIVFIFATTEMHKVPATIKSRCQQFAFRLIPIETIAGILRDTCVELGIQAEDEALFWVARESTGSLRDAYTLFDQVASFSDGNIRASLIREKLGLIGLDTLNTLAEACVQNDTARALLLIDETLNAGVAVEQFIIDLAGYYRSLLFLKAGVTRDSLLEYSPERFSALALERLDTGRLEHALELLLGLYRDIRYSISPRFDLETVVSKLCWLDRWISPRDLGMAIAGLQQALGAGALSGPAPAKINAPAAAMETSAMREIPDRSLSEGFKRIVAARAAANVAANNASGSGELTGETPPSYAPRVAPPRVAAPPWVATAPQAQSPTTRPPTAQTPATRPSPAQAPLTQAPASQAPLTRSPTAQASLTPAPPEQAGRPAAQVQAQHAAAQEAAEIPQVARVIRLFGGSVVNGQA